MQVEEMKKIDKNNGFEKKTNETLKDQIKLDVVVNYFLFIFHLKTV